MHRVFSRLFVAILVTLLLQRSRTGRSEDKGTWAAVQAWPPLPESYGRLFVLRKGSKQNVLIRLT